MPLLPVASIPADYDKAALRDAFSGRFDLHRLAAANAKRYPNPDTVRHIQAFVGLHGDDLDGAWGPTTVALLLAAQEAAQDEDIPVNGLLSTEHYQLAPTNQDNIPDAPRPAPLFTKSRASGKDGYYDLAYEPGTGRGWPRCDPQWDRVTQTPDGKPSWLGAMLRVLTGRSVGSKGVVTYSRGPDDFITLDTYSAGIAHWWAATAPEKLLLPIVERLPSLALNAWGEDCASLLLHPHKVEAITGTITGHTRYDPRTLSWLAAGWWWIARQPAALALQVELWAQDYIGAALDLVDELKLPLRELDGASQGVVLAAIARMCNSGPGLAKRVIRKYWRGGHPTGLVGALRDGFHIERSAGGYSKDGNGPGRWREIDASCRIDLPVGITGRQWSRAVAEQTACYVADMRRSFVYV